jgi:CNT family concentrative nucleoside transporter
MFVLRGLFGLLALTGIAWLCSENRRRLPFKTLLAGIPLQILLALLLLKLPAFRSFFGSFVKKLKRYNRLLSA